MATCVRCSTSLPDHARFCMACGAALPEPERPRPPARKVVTVVFSDVTGFTTLSELLDPEALRELMAAFVTAMTDVVAGTGGVMERLLGDAVMVVFGLPELHDDDAWRAVQVALRMREALEELNARLPQGLGVRLVTRTGVNTGRVLIGHDGLSGRVMGDVVGDAVNVAARLQTAAEPGEVLLGETTYRLTRRRLVCEPRTLQLKGKREPVPAYRVLRSQDGTGFNDRRITAPTLGRDGEAGVVRGAWADVVSHVSAASVTLVGSAGAGKSRLANDFRRASDARVLTARCLSWSAGSSLSPLADLVHEAVGTGPDLLEDLASLLDPQVGSAHEVARRLLGHAGLAPVTASVETLPRDLALLLRSTAAGSPLLVVVEDLHWAPQRLLDALGALPRLLSDVPLLVLGTARPELLTSHPEWAEGEHRVVEIPPLPAGVCEALVAALLGPGPATDALSGRLALVADGIPLVVEEVLAMLIDERALRRTGDGWDLVEPVSSLKIPPTISAVLDARLERLQREERSVLECAAVVGEVFTAHDLLPLAAETDAVQPALDALCDRQLVHVLPTREGYRFHHALLRDAAYEATSKRRRAGLHEQYAVHLEATAEPAGAVDVESVASHLERSWLLQRDLGATAADLSDLGSRAARALVTLGNREMGASEFDAARSCFDRGLAVLHEQNALSDELRLGLTYALVDLGDFPEAATTGHRLAATATSLPLRLRAELAADLAEVYEGSVDPLEALAGMERAIAALEQEDPGGQHSRPWIDLAAAAQVAHQGARAHEATTKAVAAATRAGTPDLAYCLVGRSLPAVEGPMPVPVALAECHEALAHVPEHTLGSALLGTNLAALEAMAGDLDASLARLDDAEATCLERGANWWLFGCSLRRGVVLLMHDRIEAAASHLEQAAEVFLRSDSIGPGATLTALRALALARLGRSAEALQLTQWAGQHLPDHELNSQAPLRCAAALSLARLGDPGRGVAPVKKLLTRMERGDNLVMLGDLHRVLGEVHLAAGAREEARAGLEHAHALYSKKGAVPCVAATTALLEAL